MTSDLWLLVRDGERDTAMQAMFAASIKHSPLLGDFIDLVVRERFRGFHDTLPKSLWTEYLDLCRSRAPEMPVWKDSTAKKLGEHVYRILSEVGSAPRGNRSVDMVGEPVWPNGVTVAAEAAFRLTAVAATAATPVIMLRRLRGFWGKVIGVVSFLRIFLLGAKPSVRNPA